MAQNITIAGASYSGVPAVNIPKTGGGTASFVDTSDANATASKIASNSTAYVNGAKITGTLVAQAAKTVSPSLSEQTAVASGMYTTGAVKVSAITSSLLASLDADFIAANILKNKNLFGLVGTLEPGVSSTYGFIRVNFPVGSSCSISKSGVTYNAPSDAVDLGRFCFPIPSTGTWTITCTDGTHTVTKTQAISGKYYYYVFTLTYTTVLFDGSNGGDVSSVTGGWYLENTSGKASTTVSSTAITGDRTAPYSSQVASAFAATQNAINLTNASTLCVTFTRATGTTVYVGNGSTASNVDGMIDGSVANVSGAVGTVQIDVSQLSGSFQIGIGRGWNSTYSQGFTVTKVWVE